MACLHGLALGDGTNGRGKKLELVDRTASNEISLKRKGTYAEGGAVGIGAMAVERAGKRTRETDVMVAEWEGTDIARGVATAVKGGVQAAGADAYTAVGSTAAAGREGARAVGTDGTVAKGEGGSIAETCAHAAADRNGVGVAGLRSRNAVQQGARDRAEDNPKTLSRRRKSSADGTEVRRRCRRTRRCTAAEQRQERATKL
jgi:hypothetical protein